MREQTNKKRERIKPFITFDEVSINLKIIVLNSIKFFKHKGRNFTAHEGKIFVRTPVRSYLNTLYIVNDKNIIFKSKLALLVQTNF